MHCKKLSNTHYSSVTMNAVNSNHLAEGYYSSTSTLIMCGSTIQKVWFESVTTSIDIRVNERDWQQGRVGRAYLYTIYIYVM